MGLFDWIELGLLGAGEGSDDPNWLKNFENAFPGSFQVTIGDALTSFIWGGRHTHIYGDEFKFVFDWEAIEEYLLSLAPGHLGTGKTGAFLLGLGGNATLVYGLDTSLKYGQTTAVKRASSSDITGGPNFLSKYLSGHATPDIKPSFKSTDSEDAQKEIDQAAGLLAGIISAVMVTAALVVELVVKLKMSTAGNIGPSTLTSLIRSADWWFTSRMAAWAVAVEQAAFDLRKGCSSLDQAKNDLEKGINDAQQAADDAAAAISEYQEETDEELAAVKGKIYVAEGRAIRGEKATAAAAADAAKGLQQLATLTGVVNKVAPDLNGDIILQSINNWRVNANADVGLTAAGDVSIFAQGTTGSSTGVVRMDAATAVSINCGANASIGMNYYADGAESNILMRAKGNGSVSVAAGSIETGARQYFTPDGLMLKFGDSLTGPRIVMSEASLQLAIGPPEAGATIELTDESITIQVGETSLTLTPASISEVVAESTRDLTAEGHVLTAAESVLNVGPQGRAYVGPTMTNEVEAARESTQALNNDTTEGANAQVASMFTVE